VNATVKVVLIVVFLWLFLGTVIPFILVNYSF